MSRHPADAGRKLLLLKRSDEAVLAAFKASCNDLGTRQLVFVGVVKGFAVDLDHRGLRIGQRITVDGDLAPKFNCASLLLHELRLYDAVIRIIVTRRDFHIERCAVG